MPSLSDDNSSAKTSINFCVINSGLNHLTSATLPNKPIILRSNSSRSLNACKRSYTATNTHIKNGLF